MESTSRPSLFVAFIPIILLIFLLSFNVYFFKDDTLSGANQIALLLAATVGGIAAVALGHRWYDVRAQIVKSISSAMPSIANRVFGGHMAP